MKGHDHLREVTRIEAKRQPGPSEGSLDSQRGKTAARMHPPVGYDTGNQIQGQKRFVVVDRVCSRPAGVGHRCQRRGTGRGEAGAPAHPELGKRVSRLHTLWVDGGLGGWLPLRTFQTPSQARFSGTPEVLHG